MIHQPVLLGHKASAKGGLIADDYINASADYHG